MPMDLSDLRPAEGSNRDRKRVGRGTGSGHGKTSGKGQKGQKARAGGGVPRRLEGGQLPIQKRMPYKRGFTNIFAATWEEVNLDKIAALGVTGPVRSASSRRRRCASAAFASELRGVVVLISAARGWRPPGCCLLVVMLRAPPPCWCGASSQRPALVWKPRSGVPYRRRPRHPPIR